MRSLSDLELGWVAGLLEGEGSFTLGTLSNRKREQGARQLQITCAMTDLDTIEKLANTVGAGNISIGKRKKAEGRENHKEIFVWALTKRNQVVPLLEQLKPLMGERRQRKIQELLDHAEQYPLLYTLGPVHGTRNTYRYYGCRCDLCRAESARYARERRRIKREEMVQEDSN